MTSAVEHERTHRSTRRGVQGTMVRVPIGDRTHPCAVCLLWQIARPFQTLVGYSFCWAFARGLPSAASRFLDKLFLRRKFRIWSNFCLQRDLVAHQSDANGNIYRTDISVKFFGTKERKFFRAFDASSYKQVVAARNSTQIGCAIRMNCATSEAILLASSGGTALPTW